MHFIIALVGAVIAALILYSRLRQAGQGGKDMIDDVKGAVRRGRWASKADAGLIDALEDPREAAAILMVQMASYDGEVTAGQKAHIKNLMMVNFACADEEAEGLYSFGRMAIGQLNDAANSLSKLLAPIHDTLTDAEKRDFVTMLERIAEIEGVPQDRQRQLVAAVRRAFSERKARQA